MEFVPNEISPLVDVYPFAMNVEGGGNAVSRTCSRDSRGEYPVLGRDERVFRGVVFVKSSKIDFLPMFSLIFRFNDSKYPIVLLNWGEIMEMVIILQTSLFVHSKIVELKKILSNFSSNHRGKYQIVNKFYTFDPIFIYSLFSFP